MESKQEEEKERNKTEQKNVSKEEKLSNGTTVLKENKLPNDPRSPSTGFRRTPIRFFPKYGSTQAATNSNSKDPRSPNKEISRTPLCNRAMKEDSIQRQLFHTEGKTAKSL